MLAVPMSKKLTVRIDLELDASIRENLRASIERPSLQTWMLAALRAQLASDAEHRRELASLATFSKVLV